MKYHVTIQGIEHLVEVRERRADGTCAVIVDGRELTARWPAAPPGDAPAEVTIASASKSVHAHLLPATAAPMATIAIVAAGRVVQASAETDRERLRRAARPRSAPTGHAIVRSTLPGVIRRVLCQPGQTVDGGTPLVTLEAMKMENELRAEAGGVVKAVHVRVGQVVSSGEPLVEMESG